MSEDFYIGYEPEMPASLVPRIRVVAAGLLLLAVVTALGLVVAQNRFSDGVFEYGQERSVEGRVVEQPYPLLLGADGSRYFLVGPGKRGAAAIADGFDGRMVRVRGSLIERAGDKMLQVSSGGIQASRGLATVPSPPLERREPVSVHGEIVDSKCHLGVMKPGEGPLHRDCAVRCLLGGAPPLLVVIAGSGRVRRIPLVSLDGGPLGVDLEAWVARPVRVRGILYARGGEQYLGVDPREIDVRE